MSFEFSYPRYLAAKKTVDDRALNHAVWEALRQSLPKAPSAPLQVLEIGAGIGTMLERMLERHLLSQAAYTGLDAAAENIHTARSRLPEWAARQGFTVLPCASQGWELERAGQSLTAHFETGDLWEFAQEPRQQGAWDLLAANAVLDLVDLPQVLPLLLRLLRPGGLFYFSLNFDGATILEPPIDPAYDELVERLYHQTMDERVINDRPSGDSRSGRHMLTQLRKLGAHVLQAGASDWVVLAGPNGYPADEAYFLRCILETMHSALTARPDFAPQLAQPRFTSWMENRRTQLARGELIYIAHQLDVVGLRPPPTEPHIFTS
jgi:SAM-dependent methyltransferase